MSNRSYAAILISLLLAAQLLMSGAEVDTATAAAVTGTITTVTTSYEPPAVAVDAGGSVYVADYYGDVVRKVDTSGTVTIEAGNGVYGFSGDGGPATSAQLEKPDGLAVDAAGNVYIADSFNDRVRKVNASGIITTVAGNGTFGFSGDGGPATSAELNQPAGVAVDTAGDLYIVDYGNQRVRKVDASGTISTVAGNGTAGFSGDGGPGASAELNRPDGVAVGAGRILYIGDLGNQRVRKVDASGTISTVAGNGTAGFSGDGGPGASAELNRPTGVAVDAAGNLYFSDSGNQRVRKVDASGTISTVAGNGTAGFSGDGGPATLAELSNPEGIAVDASGNLYIADLDNSRVRKVAEATPPPPPPPPPPAIQVTAFPVSGTLTFPIADYVAAFSDTDLTANATQYAVTVAWGDGQTSNVQAQPLSPGQPGCAATPQPSVCFSVFAQHNYSVAQSFNVLITVTKANGETALATAAAVISPLHYSFELKAWIPQPRVVDPEAVLATPFAVFQPDCANVVHPPHIAFSSYNGNDHAAYDGDYKVLTKVGVDWDGRQFTNFQGPDQLNYPEFGTTHRIISENRSGETVICEETATATSSVSATRTGPTSLDLGYSTSNPLVGPAPTIDGIAHVSIGPDGTLTVGFVTDGFPSHGLRVVREGTTQLTATLNDVSCLKDNQVMGPIGALRIAQGLSGQSLGGVGASGTLTVAPNDVGRVIAQRSGLC